MKRTIIVLSLLVSVITLCCLIWMLQETAIYASNSPDEQYVLVVMKRNIDSYLVMPGQGSDVKCFVELRSRVDGQIILRKDVSMLQNIEHIKWDADKVWINSHSAISYDGKLMGIW